MIKKSKKIVVLDPGHGGRDSGAVGCGHKEKIDNLILARAVGKRLKPYLKVKYTRKTDRYDSPSAKAKIANKYPNASLFVSFHRNDYDAAANGFEVDVKYNTGIRKKYADFVRERMHSNIGFKDRGTIVRNDLAVLNQTVMPAVLNEVGFIKNQRDTELFEKKFKTIAKIISDGILYAIGIEKEKV